MPNFLSIATTLRRWTGAFAVRRRDRVRRLTYVLGALVIAGAVTAIAIVLSSDRSGPVEARVSYPRIAAASQASRDSAAAPGAAIADAAAAGAAGSSPTTTEPATGGAGASPAVPAAPPNTADAATGTAATGASLTAECRRNEAERNWQALAQCAGKLQPSDAKLAAQLTTRATEVTRAAPHVAAVRAALHEGP